MSPPSPPPAGRRGACNDNDKINNNNNNLRGNEDADNTSNPSAERGEDEMIMKWKMTASGVG
jgi:hypothetical protein